MRLRPVIIDFESLYGKVAPPATHPHLDDNFSVIAMGTEKYIRDPRFEAHGAAIMFPTDAAGSYQRGPWKTWVPKQDLKYAFSQIDWENSFVIHHHAHFDGLILGHWYGVHPGMFGCTLSMARLLLGNHLSVSLDAVRAHFGMPKKITPYGLFQGKHWEELTPQAQQMVGEGAVDEVESIWKIFGLLMKAGFPPAELDVVDSIVKMFTNPVLELDTQMLADLWKAEAIRKADAVASLGIDAADLRSSERFCQLLEAEGVDIEYKEGANGEIPALAKNDPFMRDFLREHPNERVRALAEARLGEKSTLLHTRATTLGWTASRGPAPVYLHAYGASTIRPSGGDGCLTGDTRILTLDISGTPKYKNIVDVLITDLVWDGEEFVEHDGVAFQGYREVVSWDGIDGTPDHQVLVGKTWQDLSEALRTKTAIMDCREPTTWEVEAGRAGQRTRS